MRQPSASFLRATVKTRASLGDQLSLQVEHRCGHNDVGGVADNLSANSPRTASAIAGTQ
jgi:hypothetical protein